jgi:hypothetical protein
MSPSLLSSASFFSFLCLVDEDIADRVRSEGCQRCGSGPLHAAHYARKPRGVLAALDTASLRCRLSWCCGREGCRRRTTPPSVRFLERKVYVSVAVVLATAMRQGLTPGGERVVSSELGVDRRTVERWRTFWAECFPARPGWRAVRGLLPADFDEARLPLSLIEHFAATRPAAGDARSLALEVLFLIAGVVYASFERITLSAQALLSRRGCPSPPEARAR